MRIKNSSASFIDQLRNAQKLVERTEEYEVEENGNPIKVDIIPLKDTDVAKYTKILDKTGNDIEKVLEVSRSVISSNVKQIRDISEDELADLGVPSKNDLISAYFNYNNQTLIMKAIMDFSSKVKDNEADEIMALSEDLKN